MVVRKIWRLLWRGYSIDVSTVVRTLSTSRFQVNSVKVMTGGVRWITVLAEILMVKIQPWKTDKCGRLLYLWHDEIWLGSQCMILMSLNLWFPPQDGRSLLSDEFEGRVCKRVNKYLCVITN